MNLKNDKYLIIEFLKSILSKGNIKIMKLKKKLNYFIINLNFFLEIYN